MFSTSTDLQLLCLNTTSGSQIPARNLEELAWFCPFESLLSLQLMTSYAVEHQNHKSVPSCAVVFHRKHACRQIHPGQPQAVVFLAANRVVWQKCCWYPFPVCFQYVVLWCIVLSWVFPWFHSVPSWKMNMEFVVGFFSSIPSLLRITVGTSIRTEFLYSRSVGPTWQLTLWPKELYLCSSAGPSTLQLAAGFSPLPSCACAPGSVQMSNPCSAVLSNESLQLSEPSLRKSTCCFSLCLNTGRPSHLPGWSFLLSLQRYTWLQIQNHSLRVENSLGIESF